MAIIALVVGIIGICFFWIPFAGLLPAIGAIILGIFGKKQCDADPNITGRGMATAGVVLGAIAVGLSILVAILFFVGGMALTRMFEDLAEGEAALNALRVFNGW